MTVALDLGCSEFRSLRREKTKFVGRRVPALYAVFKDDSRTRKLLDQLNVRAVTAAGSLVVLGEGALQVAQVLKHPLVPIFDGGKLPTNDPVGRQICTILVESLLPTGAGREECVMAVPGHNSVRSSATADFLDHIIELKGYRTRRLHPARAVILSELEDERFNGVALTVGAESISLCVSHFGKPIFESHFSRGTRSVEELLAKAKKSHLWDHEGHQFLDFLSIRTWVRNFQGTLIEPADEYEQLFARHFYKLLLEAWNQMLPPMAHGAFRLLEEDIPLVLSGGATRLQGFSTLVADSLSRSTAPFRPSSIRLAALDPYSVARGLLIDGILRESPKVSA